ncbi:MAG: ribonuclease P protein component [Bacteroidales bacterium]|nr:ribonuclease P protein component [Bacteroidales bacterium]MDD4673471.1 ribonuclease P protein component [Bacteroidales bacterium]MDY0348328.1 ribonuclease P protein component [Tenuifilaceae bacterium]
MHKKQAVKKPYGFPKSERLCSKKSIEQVFASGQSIFTYPIKALFYVSKPSPSTACCQALFVVPKRKFKRAVSRNAIRRKMREAYRLNKQILTQWCLESNVEVKIVFLYVASDLLEFVQIQESIIKIMQQLAQKDVKP